MPSPSLPIPRQDVPRSGGSVPASYPPKSSPGFVPPTYMLPQYERKLYYGTNPPPMQHQSPHGSYAPVYTHTPQAQLVQYEPTRAHSHSHSHSHSHHAHHHSKHHKSKHHSSKHPTPILVIEPASSKPPPSQGKLHKSSSHKVQQSLALPPPHPLFQYSKCTGRKKALCIGINYTGQQNELRGCVNDARRVRDFLTSHWGYQSGDIVILTDDSKNPRQQPTRQNMLDAMRWLVKNAQPNDSLFFHYSGHGGQTKDLNGDEIDGWDEVIYPVDFKKSGHIIDDEMHDIMVKPLPAGCRLTALFDSCHSGTALDLPYIYSSHGRLKGRHVSDRWREKLARPCDAISWSGCADEQTSADTFAGGVAVGAMSHAFITSLTRNPKQTYQELLRSLRLILHPRFSQRPQLGSSHPINTELQFVL
ncbi:putative caspase domain containing protein [Lyophyllum shimeji]|uniref:Caspase domain containing protein n=1 Tax=Lyophyllum shimeji TaxID=47721 RepID=A0A9P3UMZ9_LYOSH|nr:putative caspase domain containing protein [Lyophyllum shimeji]